MPTTRSKANQTVFSLSLVKTKRKIDHDDSINLAKKQKRCPLRKNKKRIDVNNCSFDSDQTHDFPDVTSVSDDGQQGQALRNPTLIMAEELSDVTSASDDGQEDQAHENGNTSLNMSLEMEEVGGNISDLEYKNADEEENEDPIQNFKKNKGKELNVCSD